MTLRVALISGPMYDALYARLNQFTQQSGVAVEIAFAGDHPALNEFLATDAAADCHLISTHTKYAPSQKSLLAPLDGLLTSTELSDFTPALLALSRIDGSLYGLPRNVDVRLLRSVDSVAASVGARSTRPGCHGRFPESYSCPRLLSRRRCGR